MKTKDLKAGIILRNSKPLPEYLCVKAHELYKQRGFEYGREGGFLNKGPVRAVDSNAWNAILFELRPSLFWEGTG